MGNLNNLPMDIILDIITRLPTESILDCKLVCRPWRDLVSHHPSFHKMYVSHLNQSTGSGKLSFLVTSDFRKLQYFDFNENSDETPIENIRRFNSTLPFRSPYYWIIGSFNGIVCLYGSNEKTTCICNPVTKEYVILPKCGRDSESGQYTHRSSGFGYLALANEYKVVEIYEHDFIEVAVYTLGSGRGWRIVGRLDADQFARVYGWHGVFVNGALHWRDKIGGRVWAFDLTEEKFREHLPPPYLRPVSSMWGDYTIGELGGVLYYSIRSDSTECTPFDVWLLKEKNDSHDMKEQMHNQPLGWSKEFSLPRRELLAFTKSGSVLCFDFISFVIYDAISSTSKQLVEFGQISQIMPHNNTLVSLQELGEEDIKIMKSAEI